MFFLEILIIHLLNYSDGLKRRLFFFQGNVSKSSSSGCHREVNLEENKNSKSEKSSLFSLDSATSGKNKIKTETEPIVDIKTECHSSNGPLPNSSLESQTRPVLSIFQSKLEPTTHTNDQSIAKVYKDDNVFEVPLPPG